MKHIILLLVLTTLMTSCKINSEQDFALISGKVVNKKSDTLFIQSSIINSKSKPIKINKDGTFKDTIKMADKKYYSLFCYNNKDRFDLFNMSFYVENGYDLKLEIDMDKTSKIPLKVSGNGDLPNKFLIKKGDLWKKKLPDNRAIYNLSEAEFSEKIDDLINAHSKLLNQTNNLPASFKDFQSKIMTYREIRYYLDYLRKKNRLTKNSYTPPKGFMPEAYYNFRIDDSLSYNESTAYRFLCANLISDNYKKKQNNNQVTPKYLDSLFSAIKIKSLRNSTAKMRAMSLVDSKKIANAKAYLDYFTNLDFLDEDFKSELKAFYTKTSNLKNGIVSPKFFNYENHAGGTTSLDDFKGKYVYIDVWATWCPPCKKEIPFLKEVEKKYHDKNIVFVSISTDQKSAHKTWRKMVVEENLTGVQLFADNAFESDFISAYGIKSIPRFILIDPSGNIINYDAPRPSDPKLIELFNGLNI